MASQIWLIDHDQRTESQRGQRDRRRAIKQVPQERRSGTDRRDPDGSFMLKDELNHFMSHLEQRYAWLIESIRDKEKKRLTMIGASFGVFSFLVTVALTIFQIDSPGIEQPISMFLGASVLVFLSMVALINTAVIKHIATLKLDHLMAIRQINCVRQAIHTTLFAKIEGHFPRQLKYDMKEKRDYKDTILDQDSTFWRLYGRHEKYPLNNVALRSRYRTWRVLFIWFTSSDFFAIFAIAGFTIGLLAAPGIFLTATADSLNISPGVTTIMTQVSTNVSWIFSLLVFSTVVFSLVDINKKLENDENIVFPHIMRI